MPLFAQVHVVPCDSNERQKNKTVDTHVSYGEYEAKNLPISTPTQPTVTSFEFNSMKQIFRSFVFFLLLLLCCVLHDELLRILFSLVEFLILISTRYWTIAIKSTQGIRWVPSWKRFWVKNFQFADNNNWQENLSRWSIVIELLIQHQEKLKKKSGTVTVNQKAESKTPFIDYSDVCQLLSLYFDQSFRKVHQFDIDVLTAPEIPCNLAFKTHVFHDMFDLFDWNVTINRVSIVCLAAFIGVVSFALVFRTIFRGNIFTLAFHIYVLKCGCTNVTYLFASGCIFWFLRNEYFFSFTSRPNYFSQTRFFSHKCVLILRLFRIFLRLFRVFYDVKMSIPKQIHTIFKTVIVHVLISILNSIFIAISISIAISIPSVWQNSIPLKTNQQIISWLMTGKMKNSYIKFFSKLLHRKATRAFITKRSPSP